MAMFIVLNVHFFYFPLKAACLVGLILSSGMFPHEYNFDPNITHWRPCRINFYSEPQTVSHFRKPCTFVCMNDMVNLQEWNHQDQNVNNSMNATGVRAWCYKPPPPPGFIPSEIINLLGNHGHGACKSCSHAHIPGKNWEQDGCSVANSLVVS